MARGAPLAENLDTESVRLARELARNVAERERAADAVSVGAGGDPADDPSAVPDGLIRRGVRVPVGDTEGDEAQLAALLFLPERRGAADELALLQVDEASQAGLVRAVDRPVLARPGAEAL